MSNAVELLKPPEFHDVEVISPRCSPELTRPFRYLLDAMTEAKWHNCARQIRKGRQVIRMKRRITMFEPLGGNRSNSIIKFGALCCVRGGPQTNREQLRPVGIGRKNRVELAKKEIGDE